MANISVLGAGSWGLGLALLLNNNGHNVTVWSVLKDEVEVKKEQPKMESSEKTNNNKYSYNHKNNC